MSICYLNGEFMPLGEAKISVLDRGFLFADGIYEVIPVYQSKIFRLAAHLKRLHNSLQAIHLDSPVSDDTLTQIFHTLVERNADLGPNQVIYLQISRGAQPTRHHNIPETVTPTLFITLKTLPKQNLSDVAQGKSAIVCDDIRWHRCDIKSVSLLANVLLNQMAKNQNADEAILIRDGMLTEGASSNVFVIKSGVIMTPARSVDILGGITRDLVIELAQAHKMPLQEGAISKADLFDADEVWITSSTREIFPITLLDGQPVGTGEAGPVWQQMIDHYQHYIQSL